MQNIPFQDFPNPCYVVDEHKFRQNLELIASVKKRAGVEIIVAFKGFATWSIFPILHEYEFHHATASSLSEAKLANEEMKTPAHTYAPVYTEEEIVEIAHLSSHLTFNSLSVYKRFATKVKEANPNISLGLRINPEFSEVETDLYNPCVAGSRLGIVAEDLPVLPEHVEGLHFHALCESGSEDLQKLLATVEKRFGHLFPHIKWLNMGGGHLMTRKGYNIELLITLLTTFKAKYPHLQIILEPGSAFAWDTGYLVTRIEDIVENHGIKTAIINASFAAHMPDCLEMPYKPKILSALEESDPAFPTYRIGGNSCLSGDFVGVWSFEKPLHVGDIIVFNDMIHYTMVKTTTFNGVKHPSIGIWNPQKGFSLIRQFGYEDYKNRLS